ncbi:Glucoside xylosyltransferase [Nesidiocoris tenuis]|uniref:Glucoside xylosyltransferase n=1 Tax=Nesidiocoris tenuis TaxID=355587 RepID=A0ABN7ASF6_9HEMI|nr:Glucoside xylosyltransferase [Nesidiocoris tenuis]
MVLLHRFCFIFTIRLGTIFICSINLILNTVLLAYLFKWVNLPEADTANFIHENIGHKKVAHGADLIQAVEDNPALYSQLALTISIAYGVSCILGTFGAFACQEGYLWPFIILNIARDVCAIGVHIFFTTLIKENSQDLGLLIGVTLAGSFILMFAFYCDACVYSLRQVLGNPVLRELAEETIGIMAETVNQPAMVYREPGAFNPANLRADQNLGTRRSAIQAISPILRGRSMQPVGVAEPFRLPGYPSRMRYPNGYPNISTQPADRGYATLIAPVY